VKLYDATLGIHEKMGVFPGDPPFKAEPVSRIQTGDNVNLTRISMGTHLGTHVDPPAHFIENGATVDQIALETLVGPGVVADLRGCAQIDRRALEKASVAGTKRVLLKTDNGPRLLASPWHPDTVYLTEEGARYLVENRIRLVGIDALSIEHPDNPGSLVHHILLEGGVLVAEGVHLLEIPPGEYEIFCLPLKIKGADGAPARILLRDP
jgi:arylformamidase